jgi:hypothetical protein
VQTAPLWVRVLSKKFDHKILLKKNQAPFVDKLEPERTNFHPNCLYRRPQNFAREGGVGAIFISFVQNNFIGGKPQNNYIKNT